MDIILLPKPQTRVCSVCSKEKLLYTEYYYNANRRYYNLDCKECHSSYRQRWYQENKDRIRIQRLKGKTVRVLYDKEYYRLKRKQEKVDLKNKVLTYYGNGICKCIKCGYSDIRALSIDHINGGGCSHRKLIRRGNLYQWLDKQNYPIGYQTLCMNCQFIKDISK